VPYSPLSHDTRALYADIVPASKADMITSLNETIYLLGSRNTGRHFGWDQLLARAPVGALLDLDLDKIEMWSDPGAWVPLDDFIHRWVWV
jgi:hypothetical protein